MRVIMKSFHGPDLKPGDVADEFDETEARRLISVGGAREPTAAELAQFAEKEAFAAREAEKAKLKAMTVPELTALAADGKVDLTGLTKKDDIIAAIERAYDALTSDGPTVAQWVAAGYKATAYPPSGYPSKSSPEEIAAAVAAQA